MIRDFSVCILNLTIYKDYFFYIFVNSTSTGTILALQLCEVTWNIKCNTRLSYRKTKSHRRRKVCEIPNLTRSNVYSEKKHQ